MSYSLRDKLCKAGAQPPAGGPPGLARVAYLSKNGERGKRNLLGGSLSPHLFHSHSPSVALLSGLAKVRSSHRVLTAQRARPRQDSFFTHSAVPVDPVPLSVFFPSFFFQLAGVGERGTRESGAASPVPSSVCWAWA
eukprot:2385624-Amphidinium_carterae.1